MALPVQIAKTSIAVFAHQNISDEGMRHAMLGELDRLMLSEVGDNPYINIGALGHAARERDRIVSRLLSDWIDEELTPLRARIGPPMPDWSLASTPFLDRVDCKALEFDESLLKKLSGTSSEIPHSEVCHSLVKRLLPQEILDRLIDFSEGYSPYSAMLLQGIPLKALAGTLLGVGKLLGEPYAETHETRNIVQDIRPLPRYSHSQTSASSEVPLLDHVENVWTERVPDWVCVACVQNIEKAETTILHPVQAIYSMVQAGLSSEIGYLFDREFWVRDPESFGSDVGKRYGFPLFTGYFEHPQVHADFADMGSDSARHAEAYEIFKHHCGLVRRSVCLEPGDILLIRNTGHTSGYLYQQAMHGRGAFRANSVEGLERHLMRILVQAVSQRSKPI